ncbi:hypothetical protein [Reichenbachiella versicolor]|uniref:hypothetical protein n=1 Tax=Reichenbachiella versicolor TaxID=1821036 RepID=UPI000D6DF577|nr:hypothetical protein [Reichenbachiella versicolor]
MNKKLSLIIGLIVLSISSKAQINNLGSDNTGSLHFGNKGVIIKYNSGDRGLLEIHSPDGGNRLAIQSLSGASYLGSLDSKPLLLQTEGGNVGIGVVNPQHELSVRGSIALESYNSFLYAKLDQPIGLLQPLIGVEGFNTVIKGRNNHEIKIQTTGHGEVHLLGHKVGIGTTNPEMEVGVAGNIALQGYNSFLYAKLDQPIGLLQPLIGVEGFDTVIKGRKDHDIKIETSSHGEIHMLGRYVGIGTTNPDALLAVNGTIHCEEVLVDTNVPDVPDYVFEEDYDLRSLEDTKSYIQANKHLPEVPSAVEMSENGMNLTEMNLLLLKKIEELTLHQIELLERIKKLEER